jgi:preprotein translocase subunit YajC
LSPSSAPCSSFSSEFFSLFFHIFNFIFFSFFLQQHTSKKQHNLFICIIILKTKPTKQNKNSSPSVPLILFLVLFLFFQTNKTKTKNQNMKCTSGLLLFVLVLSIALSIEAQATRNSYDFIIVGAGSAGSVVAGELADTCKRCSILVIEAGGDSTDPLVHDTLRQGELFAPEYEFLRDDMTTVPSTQYYNKVGRNTSFSLFFV